jgi:threonine synthase
MVSGLSTIAPCLKGAEPSACKIPKGSTIVCTLTGHGLKDPDTAITQCKDTMININPVMEEVKNAILDNM